MRLFYICHKDTTRHLKAGWHALDLGNNKLLLCVQWADPLQEARWASRPEVISLPHPIFQSNQPLSDNHRAHCAKRFQLEDGHNVHDLIKQAALQDPWMRLHVL